MSYDPFGRRLYTYSHDGQTFFELSEIAHFLRAANLERLSTNLDDDEIIPLSTLTGRPEHDDTLLISEPGVFKVALRMRHPAARKLLRFVAHSVLPALRENGSYKLPRKGTEGAELVRFLRDQIEAATPTDDTAGTLEAEAV